MRPQEFKSFLKEQPFRPIRVTLTDGRTIEVKHPDQALVLRSSVVIGIPAKDQSDEFYDYPTTISLLHVMQIEYLEAASKP